MSLLTIAIWTPHLLPQRPYRSMYRCASNEKRLAAAMLMYADRHHDHLPPAENWSDAIALYIADSRAFVCPEARAELSGYAFNRALSGERIQEIPDPGRTIMLFEGNLGWNGSGTATSLPDVPRHFGQDVFAFADGHVKVYHRGEAQGSTWNPE